MPVDRESKAGNYVGSRPKDESKLSRKPSQIRKRLRRKGASQARDMEMYAEVVWGRPIEEWDIEELARGRPRNKAGGFSGPRPKWITPAIQMEAKRRLVEDTYGLLAGHLNQAISTMAELMLSEEVDMNGKPIVDAKTKFAAAAFIIEHIMGKPKALVELKADTEGPAQALAAAIVLDDGKPQGHLVLEGEFVDDDEMEDADDGNE